MRRPVLHFDGVTGRAALTTEASDELAIEVRSMGTGSTVMTIAPRDAVRMVIALVSALAELSDGGG